MTTVVTFGLLILWAGSGIWTQIRRQHSAKTLATFATSASKGLRETVSRLEQSTKDLDASAVRLSESARTVPAVAAARPPELAGSLDELLSETSLVKVGDATVYTKHRIVIFFDLESAQFLESREAEEFLIEGPDLTQEDFEHATELKKTRSLESMTTGEPGVFQVYPRLLRGTA